MNPIFQEPRNIASDLKLIALASGPGLWVAPKMGRKVRENPMWRDRRQGYGRTRAQIISTGLGPCCAVLYLAPGWSGMR